MLGDYLQAGVVAALLAFNAGLGFFQENRAQATLEALKSRLALSNPPPKTLGGSLQAAERTDAAFFHSHGSSSLSRFAGCSAMRASTSASHA